jgi:predicted NBD/HSP70 family sugar kinase
VLAAARHGDAAARAVLQEVAHDVGVGMANLINLFTPDVITIGGWVAREATGMMLPVIRETAESATLPALAGQTRIVESQLGEDAVAIGAAALMVEQLIGGSAVPRATPKKALPISR